MNCFSNQRFYAAFSTQLKALLLLSLLSLTLGLSLSAQDSADQYRGTWQIETPDDGAQIIIIKRNGRASYFWGDNADRTVYQGTWTSDDNAATITWENGSTHRIDHDDLGYAITFRDVTFRELYASQALQVPKEVLGQWAKAPTDPESQTSDRDKAKGFFGTWQVGSGDQVEYVIVDPNRSAASTWSQSEDGSRGLRGSWARQGSELHIAWDTGNYSILKQNERDFTYKLIPPGTIIEEDESPLQSAIRTNDENIPADWFAQYTEEEEINTGGIAFASYKDTNRFYRGTWIIQHRADAFELIEISRFGGLKTSVDRTLEGTWRMTEQDIFMRWDDGMRKVLSPIGYGFILYEYKPGRPLDGVPTRILPITPQDVAKLVENLEGRKEVSQQMHELAEAAGINTTPKDTGLGHTFMRWAWPFDDNDPELSTEALIEDSYSESNSLNPWWWPFWSEYKPGSSDSTTELIETDVTEETTVITDESETIILEVIETNTQEVRITEPQTEAIAPSADEPSDTTDKAPSEVAPKAAKKQSKADWKWPF